MFFNPRAAGFAWPEPTTLTNPGGQTLDIKPSAANLAAVTAAGHRRVGGCYRYYSTSQGELDELSLLYWIAGGEGVCIQLLAAIKSHFDSHQPRVTAESLHADLDQQGYTVQSIRVVLGWLVQDGYVALQVTDTGVAFEKLRW